MQVLKCRKQCTYLKSTSTVDHILKFFEIFGKRRVDEKKHCIQKNTTRRVKIQANINMYDHELHDQIYTCHHPHKALEWLG